MTEEGTNRRSLVRIITVRLALVSLLAIALQVAVVVVRTYLVEDEMNRSYVTQQTHLLLRAIAVGPGGLVIKPSRLPSEYGGTHGASYAFRILDEGGRVVAEHNGERIAALSPWQVEASRAQDFWLLDLEEAQKLYVAGGIRRKVSDQRVWIEVATFGDPARTYLGIVAAEVAGDVWLPTLPLVALTLGVAILSVRMSLLSLVRAAKHAETLSPLDGSKQIDISGMPREAAILAVAINGLLDRVRELFKSQRMFLARAAHELQTPLAVMLLELGRFEDPGMRRLEKDVRSMSSSVDRLLTLARLEATNALQIARVDIGQLADEVADRLRDWAAQTQHQLTLTVCKPTEIEGDANAIREALRNLVENAVRHTPPGTKVHVTVGPGASFVVEDGGPGLAPDAIEELFEPFKKGVASGEGAGLGLAIVRQTIDLHHGGLQVDRSRLGGARFSITLNGAAPGSTVGAEA
jgi:two-component system, OmpR family, sensor histidine kinase QseC